MSVRSILLSNRIESCIKRSGLEWCSKICYCGAGMLTGLEMRGKLQEAKRAHFHSLLHRSFVFSALCLT